MESVAMKDTPPITPALPDDPAALQSMVAVLTRERDEADAARVALGRRVGELEVDKTRLEVVKLRLEMELLRLKKWVYGPRADRLAPCRSTTTHPSAR